MASRNALLKSLYLACGQYFLPAAAATALLTGCASGLDESPTAEEHVDLANSVTATLANVAEVRDNELVFPASTLEKFSRVTKSGDRVRLLDMIADYQTAATLGEASEPVYLVGDRAANAWGEDGAVDETSKNPLGFSRQALSYTRQGDDIVISTAAASLEQVLGDMDVAGSITLGEESGPAQTVEGGGNNMPGPSLPRIDLTGLELWRNGTAVIRLGPTYLDVSSKIDYELKVEAEKVQKVHLVIHGQVDAQLVLEAEASGGVKTDFKKELFSQPFLLPTVGNVPLTLRVSVSAGCSVGASAQAKASAGARATAFAYGGFEWERHVGLKGIGDSGFEPEVIYPTFEIKGNVNASCYLEPRYEVLLFDMIGPFNSLKASTDLDFTVPGNVVVHAGLSGHVGGTLRVFSRELGEFRFPPLFEFRYKVYEGPSF